MSTEDASKTATDQKSEKAQDELVVNDKESKMDNRSAYFNILFAVSLYWFVSITLVFLNKSLLSGDHKLDAPLFITWYQCVVTVGGLYLIKFMSKSSGEKFQFPDLTIRVETCKKILPLSLVFICMITFNNLCLKYVGISFYYIGRSLTTVFNVALTYFILGKTTSLKAILCCFTIIFGFWLGVDQEDQSGTFSLSGTIFGVLASLFVSMYSIYMKKVMPAVDDNIWLLTFYNNINACVLFLPLIVVTGEIDTILTDQIVFSPYFWGLMSLGGIFGFAIGYVTGLQIKVTSPLTHNISGTAKAAFQTVLATYVNSEIKTVMWWVSNMIVLLGSALYARVRQQEMEANKS